MCIVAVIQEILIISADNCGIALLFVVIELRANWSNQARFPDVFLGFSIKWKEYRFYRYVGILQCNFPTNQSVHPALSIRLHEFTCLIDHMGILIAFHDFLPPRRHFSCLSKPRRSHLTTGLSFFCWTIYFELNLWNLKKESSKTVTNSKSTATTAETAASPVETVELDKKRPRPGWE